MYNGNDIHENIAARKLNILKGFSEVDNALEKAKNRQVGEIHSNGKWVWTQLPNGKYDWRTKKDSSDNSHSDNIKLKLENYKQPYQTDLNNISDLDLLGLVISLDKNVYQENYKNLRNLIQPNENNKQYLKNMFNFVEKNKKSIINSLNKIVEKDLDNQNDFENKKLELKNTEDDLKLKLKDYKFKNGQNHIIFSNNSRGVDSTGSIEVMKLGDGTSSYLVHFLTKKEVSSISLADQSKAYQTTSARLVKHKTIKDQKHVDNIKDVYKIIDRHLNKISK